MPDDIIHLEGEPVRALTAALPALPELLQTLEGFKNMSETAAQLMQAVTSNAEATASLRATTQSLSPTSSTMSTSASPQATTPAATVP